jgi:hypothetical protein
MRDTYILSTIGLFALLVFSANVFVIVFISHEQYLYYWDLVGYWEKARRIATDFPAFPSRTVASIIRSVRNDDYNDLAAFLLLPGTLVLGGSRLSYVLSILNIFALPAVAFCALLQHKVSTVLGHDRRLAMLLIAVLALLSPVFWNPILQGYLDVGGVVLLAAILLLYLPGTSYEQGVRKPFLVGILIPTALLFRRWYAYWGIGFYAALVFEHCRSLLWGDRRKGYRNMLLTGAMGVVSALFLFAVAPMFTIRIATTDYSDLYSAYRFSSSLLQALEHVIRYAGLLWFTLSLAGFAVGLSNRGTRRFFILLFVQSVVVFVLFAKTQDFGYQHHYLLFPAMLIGTGVVLTALATKRRWISLGALLSLLAINFISAFGPGELWERRITGHLFTTIRHTPWIRNDIPEMKRMLNVLKNTLTGPDDSVYVLASSRTLNSDIVRMAYLTLGRDLDVSERVLFTHDVDLSNGFPTPLLRASHVLVADPIQYHLRPEDQRVVGIPARLVLDGQGIGAAYRRLPLEFNLDGQVKVYLYEKVAPLADADVSALADMFKRYYPDHPRTYQVDTAPR